VAVLDDLSTGRERNLPPSPGQVDLFRGSINDPEIVQRACHGADYVLHLAARTSVPRSVKEPGETNRINVDGMLVVLLAARDAGVRRVVFSGSSAVYGETPTLPKREDMPPAPISPYGVSKLVGELYGQVFHRVYGLEFVTLRYFNVFGPRQDPGSPYSGVLSLFITAMQKGVPPTVYGDGEHSRDFTFVENAVQANLLACEMPGIAGMVFNAGTGRRYTLNQTLALLEKFAGRPARANYLQPRAGDIRDSQADISLAREKLGYDPRVGFEEGLRRTWEWYCASH
jgi:UDP-glucose 4-epimerase